VRRATPAAPAERYKFRLQSHPDSGPLPGRPMQAYGQQINGNWIMYTSGTRKPGGISQLNFGFKGAVLWLFAALISRFLGY